MRLHLLHILNVYPMINLNRYVMTKNTTNTMLMSSKRSLAGRIMREHMYPYRYMFLGALFFMLLAALANGAIPFVLKYVFDDIFLGKNQELLPIISVSVFGAFFVRGLASFGESVLMATIGQRIICDLQNRLFTHLMALDLSYFNRHQSGELISRLTNDISLLRFSVSTAVVGLGKDAVSLIVMISVMFFMDWMLACVAFILLPTIILPISKISRRMRKVTHNTQDQFGKITGQLSQIFQGIRVVKSYGMEGYEIGRVHGAVTRVCELMIKATRIQATTHPIIEALGGLSSMLIIGYGGWQVIHGTRTAGDFISFMGAMLLCYDPLKRLGALNSNLQQGFSAAQRVFEVIDTQPTIVSSPDAKPITKMDGNLEFKDVTFRYNSEVEALKGITLTIPQGTTVALVGASGSGKSTIMNLIPRFYDVTSGDILIDGQSTRGITLDSLRHHIGLVSQEIMLFDDTIYNNIAYGRLDATAEEIRQAAKAAAAHDFIEALPQGYDTLAGENGIVLSGGQRQRIAIARAMLKNAPILLLDEATSALDTHSERFVQEALDKLMAGKTTLIVAHRLSTIVGADQIYVLDQGCIVEQGNHADLITKDGYYAALWLAQSTANTQPERSGAVGCVEELRA